MLKEEFCSLPLRMALGLLYDLTPGLADVPAIRGPLPPKYDAKFTKAKGSYCWMSEMTLSDLQWWHGRKAESAKSGSQWADKDAKQAETLTRWIKWRECFPIEQWFGERGDKKTTGAPPSREPKLHSWSDSPRGGSSSGGGGSSGDDDYGNAPAKADDDYGNGTSDDNIPFARCDSTRVGERWWKF